MMLATSDDYDYPHIDWLCRTCEMVYCSAGYPDETRCMEGHGAGWRPEPSQVEDYIEFLESLDPGDGIVVSGRGPGTLMGPVESTDHNSLVTESIDAPRYEIQWSSEDGEIEFRRPDDEYDTWSPVYHVERVEIRYDDTGTEQEGPDR